MQRYSIQEFIEKTSQQDKGQGLFEMETERLLEVNLNGSVWIKTGGMVAYRGDVKFTREGVMEHGLGKLLKRSFTGEGTKLTKAEGRGSVYIADMGKKVSILHLENDAIFVNGNDLLAFEPTLNWDVKMMKKLAAVMSGGLFNIRLEGTGLCAITTHYDPITLVAQPGQPVFTDPNATVAWSGSLQPEFKTDMSFKTFLGRGSGESLQMAFNGQGFVVIQPYEEVYFQNSQGGGT